MKQHSDQSAYGPTKKYQFGIGESIGLIVLLLGLPGAFVGIGMMLQDGVQVLNIPVWAWRLYGICAVVIVACGIVTNNFKLLIALAITPIIVLTTGFSANMEVQSSIAPLDNVLAEVRKPMAWFFVVVCPVVFAVVSIGMAYGQVRSNKVV